MWGSKYSVVNNSAYLGQDLPHDHNDLDGLKRKIFGDDLDNPLASTMHKVHIEDDGRAQKDDGDKNHDCVAANHAFGTSGRQGREVAVAAHRTICVTVRKMRR